jgi:hypothetical protein
MLLFVLFELTITHGQVHHKMAESPSVRHVSVLEGA